MKYSLHIKPSDKLAFGLNIEPTPNFWYITRTDQDGRHETKLSAEDIEKDLNTSKWNNSFGNDGYIGSDADAVSILKELHQR
mgnify:CR=1 FL=1